MEKWTDNQPEPKHVIAAYYPASSLVEVTQNDKVIKEPRDHHERPHRVELSSESLLQEMTEITGIECDEKSYLL